MVLARGEEQQPLPKSSQTYLPDSLYRTKALRGKDNTNYPESSRRNSLSLVEQRTSGAQSLLSRAASLTVREEPRSGVYLEARQNTAKDCQRSLKMQVLLDHQRIPQAHPGTTRRSIEEDNSRIPLGGLYKHTLLWSSAKRRSKAKWGDSKPTGIRPCDKPWIISPRCTFKLLPGGSWHFSGTDNSQSYDFKPRKTCD